MPHDEPPPLDDPDALVKGADPDRWLTTRFIADAGKRADVLSLYAFDAELARAPRVASNALIGEIRLTWWAETVAEIFEGKAVRRHPVAEALAKAVERYGLDRERLDALIEGRMIELDKRPLTEAEAIVWADTIGGGMMGLVAKALDPAASIPPDAGRAFGLCRAVVAGLVPHDVVRAALEVSVTSAKSARFSVDVFPAVMPLVIAQAPAEGDVVKRLRLVWASLRGKV
ncbi:MAG: squalene/phytoene synthase family protein [Caulobacteraceae bacterium]